MAQRTSANPDLNQSPATPFNMGSGFVNPNAAIPVFNYTSLNCSGSTARAADLNLPSITIVKLNQSRTVTNIAVNESYIVIWSPPYGVPVSVTLTSFFVASGQTQILTVNLKATVNSPAATFGRIGI